MRLIDADSLQKLFNATSSALLSDVELSKDIEHMVRAFLMVSEMISDAPTVDAEPVVRCEDCLYSWVMPKEEQNVGEYRCEFWYAEMHGDDYCSCGKRREDGNA